MKSTTEPQAPALLTSAEVADLLRVSQATLSRWRHDRRGPAWTDLHGLPRYVRADIVAYVEGQRRGR